MGTGRPTVVDVAADAGVSLKTVSRVINDVPTVDPELAARVHASIERLGFRRNTTAANLRAGTSDTIGLVTADLANPFYTTIASAVSVLAIAHRHQVIMASTDENGATERTLALDLCQRRVGGLILVPSGDDQSYLAAEVRLGTPVVFLDRPGRSIEADAVLLDNRGGAFDGVRSLVEAGHRRIALLFDSLGIHTMAERRAGAEVALAGGGADRAPALLSTDAHSPASARTALAGMLAAADPPTAVFCANNRATIGAVEAIAAHGATVAVVGFDDFEFSRLLPFEVTIVDYDTAGMGTAAAEALFRRMGGDLSPAEQQLIPTRLVRRGGR
jgi:LacI family transcriptional regulator